MQKFHNIREYIQISQTSLTLIDGIVKTEFKFSKHGWFLFKTSHKMLHQASCFALLWLTLNIWNQKFTSPCFTSVSIMNCFTFHETTLSLISVLPFGLRGNNVTSTEKYAWLYLVLMNPGTPISQYYACIGYQH